MPTKVTTYDAFFYKTEHVSKPQKRTMNYFFGVCNGLQQQNETTKRM
jgi:hypothetical protein